jgi:LPXTG-motif cell wall-anchored protein
MTQSMIGFVIGLAVLIGVAGVLGRRYRRDHPESSSGSAARMHEWLDAHHMSWLHHRH